MRVRVDGQDIDNPSTLEVSDSAIMFAAAARGTSFRKLNDMIFVFSRNGDPRALLTPIYRGVVPDPARNYTLNSITYSKGKLHVMVLEESGTPGKASPTLMHYFSEASDG